MTRREALRTAQKHPNVKILGYNRNQGKGAAFLHGYRYSKGDVVALLDANLDMPSNKYRYS